MNSFWPEVVRSVEHIWVLWLTGCIAAVASLSCLCRRIDWRTCRKLHAAEDGAAYSLSYVLTVPFLALLIGLITDTSLILTTKIGTAYAAYAASRSAVVWYPSGVAPAAAQSKAQTAGARAMVPFASAAKVHQPLDPPPWYAAELLLAHERYAREPAKADYLLAKCRYAAWATQVDIQIGQQPSSNVVATLTYRAPFHLSGIGRILGTKAEGGAFYYRTIKTVIELENHAPRCDPPNDSIRPLGINYVPSLD